MTDTTYEDMNSSELIRTLEDVIRILKNRDSERWNDVVSKMMGCGEAVATAAECGAALNVLIITMYKPSPSVGLRSWRATSNIVSTKTYRGSDLIIPRNGDNVFLKEGKGKFRGEVTSVGWCYTSEITCNVVVRFIDDSWG